MAQLEVKNVTLGYEGRAIVRELSFCVEKGDYLIVVGENGSGKSTLMKTLLGLQKKMSGEILFGDGLTPDRIGYLPQQTAVQKDFPATVEEIVLSGFQGQCGIRPFYRPEERKAALKNLDRMGALAFRKRCFRELSGGQKQRVLLARALCAARDILLLDEPVAGLDPETMAGMYELIRQLNREGITIIMISHDVEHAFKDANRILRIGTPLFFGTKEEYLSGKGEENHESV